MNLKFLPIGTVCLVENVNKKQMIIGYSKSGYDYVAVEYPKGFESDNKLSYFNHGQVQELYSLGYKNEESRIFNGTLISVQTVESDDDSDAAEGITPTSNLTVEEIPVISNPFQFDDNGIVISDSNEEILDVQEKEQEKSALAFDESGIVVSDGYEENPIPTQIQFDENGIVVADLLSEKEVLEEQKNRENDLTFDDNGIVISDGNEEFSNVQENEIPKEESSLTFDENGIVMSDGIESTSPLEEIPEEDNTPMAISDLTEEASVNKDTTIDVSDVVKQIEETITEAESKTESLDDSTTESEEPQKAPKKEKRGLFHFGKK